jgi:predicted alpha/beta hydrolase
VHLAGHVWQPRPGAIAGTVIVNPATGVLARYYHRYARYLAGAGFVVLTYDYRGIGGSRPNSLRGCGYRWVDWGRLDFAAVLELATQRWPEQPVSVVGHSIGGFLPGAAANACRIDRLLTVGAQYAWWGDYAAGSRLRLFCKWHLAMPALALTFGYFPGRRLGWLEDLPRDVALEWSFRRRHMEMNYSAAERRDLLASYATIHAPILAIGLTDDELGTPAAIDRGLSYYRAAPRTRVLLDPSDLGHQRVGHFGLFHDRHRDDFWAASLKWLYDGVDPFPEVIDQARRKVEAGYMNDDPTTDDVRQQLELTGLAYADWEKESADLRRITDRSALSGFVDRDHLQRAAEMAAAIEAEMRMLDGLGAGVDDETAQQIRGIRDRLGALLEGLREAERKLRDTT